MTEPQTTRLRLAAAALPALVLAGVALLSTTVRGHRAWRVTFFDPRTPAWFSAVLDQRTLRTLELQMLTTAHFMHHVYRAFNEPLRLVPPR